MVAPETVAVHQHLRELEVLQDRAFAAAGKLMAALIEARIERNIAPSVGKSVRVAIADVAVQISHGQGRTADLHRLLEKLASAHGIATTVESFGDETKYDPA